MNTTRAEELGALQARMSELRAYLKRLADREAELRPRTAALREERAAFLSRTLLPELAALEERLARSRTRIRVLQSRAANLRNLSGRVGDRVMHGVMVRVLDPPWRGETSTFEAVARYLGLVELPWVGGGLLYGVSLSDLANSREAVNQVVRGNLADVEARLEEEKSAYRVARDELRAEFTRLRARWVEEANRLYPRDPATSAELAKIAAEITRVKGQVDLTVLQTISVLAGK